MTLAIRIFLAVVVFVASYLFIYWVPFSLLPVPGSARWLADIGALVGAVAVTWFAWSRSRFPLSGALSTIAIGAITVGALGFAVGFFGPLLLSPEANQGPLLGIFITGPLGAVVGALGGFVYSRLAKSRRGAA